MLLLISGLGQDLCFSYTWLIAALLQLCIVTPNMSSWWRQYLQEPFRKKKQKFNLILSANFLFSNSCHKDGLWFTD